VTAYLKDFMRGTLVPSAIGGAGALGLDVLLALPFIPDTMKTGPMRPVVRLAGAVALGMVAGMISNRRIAHQVAAGATTVVLYDTMKSYLAQMAGGKIPGIGLYEIPGIGMYEVTPQPQLGYTDSGIQVGQSMNADEETMAAYGIDGMETGVYR
jgi:hypothetical protein